MNCNGPCKGDGEFPAFLFHGGLDVTRGEVVGEIDVKFDVLKVRRVVDHIKYETSWDEDR